MEWKTPFLKIWVSSLLVLFLALFGGSLGTYAAEIEEIHNVTVKGQTYHVVELLSVQRDSIPAWNILLLRRGSRFHSYRVVDSDYPIRFYDSDWLPNAKQFKDVPDRRPFNEKYPKATLGASVANNVISFVSLFL